jgi:hypothetical protein
MDYSTHMQYNQFIFKQELYTKEMISIIQLQSIINSNAMHEDFPGISWEKLVGKLGIHNIFV